MIVAFTVAVMVIGAPGRKLDRLAGMSGEAWARHQLVVARDAIPSEKELRLVVERLGSNLAQVASYFRKDRRQVYRWLQRFGIDVGDYRDHDD